MGFGMDKRFVDTYELTLSGQQISGQTPLVQFKRLVADLPAQSDASASWTITGTQDALGQRFLDVTVKAAPMVQCQRCMGSLPWSVDSSSRLQVVETEAELDAEDDPDTPPEEWVEPVLASTHLDVLALVEDELILALPYVPMHDSCSTEALDKAGQPDEHEEPVQPSPFAVLSQLKKN